MGGRRFWLSREKFERFCREAENVLFESVAQEKHPRVLLEDANRMKTDSSGDNISNSKIFLIKKGLPHGTIHS